MDNLEIGRHLREGLSPDATENDRQYQRMLKANQKYAEAWQLRGWNEAYTLSLESVDMDDPIEHVKHGIEHIVESLRHNPTHAELYFEIGWYLQNRISQMETRSRCGL
jgi:hypothetical protein